MARRPSESIERSRSRFVQNGGLRIHWLDAPVRRAAAGEVRGTVCEASSRWKSEEGWPLVFVPGFGEEARDHEALIAVVAGGGIPNGAGPHDETDQQAEAATVPARPRRVIVPDLRGRGASDAPNSGYTLQDHVGDLSAVLQEADSARVHLACYSRGTAYAVSWALRHPSRVASLVIGDYPAEHIVPPPEGIAFLAERERFGRPLTERVPRRVMERVFADCRNERFYAALGAAGFPVSLVHGGRESSMVTVETLRRYRTAIPRLEVEVFEKSGHDLWRPDPTRFAWTVARFATRHDGIRPPRREATTRLGH